MTAPRALLAALLLIASPVVALAQAPAQQEFDPPGGKPARALLFVSGQSGAANYVDIAKQYAAQGFYVSLIDGNDVFKPNNAGEAPFKAAVARAQASPKALPGNKLLVVGSSLGGGAVMTYAARMPDQVAAIVAYFPYTAFVQNPAGFAGQIKVPTLMLAAVKDTWKNCCMIDMARNLAGASPKAGDKPLLTIHEYKDAEHGFTLKGPAFRKADADDALKRALAHLRANMGEAPKTN